MLVTQHQIVVSDGPCEAHGVAHTCVHHRLFPENWCQGETAMIAAQHLLNLFEKNLDSVAGIRHRESIEQAIVDIRAFLDDDA